MINNLKMMSNGCGFLQKLQKLSLIFMDVTNELLIDIIINLLLFYYNNNVRDRPVFYIIK